MATFVVPCHHLVTEFTNPDNLTNDIFIFNSMTLNKSLVNILCNWTGNLSCLHVIAESKKMFFIFNTQEILNGHKRLTNLIHSGTTRENQVVERSLTVLHHHVS